MIQKTYSTEHVKMAWGLSQKLSHQLSGSLIVMSSKCARDCAAQELNDVA